MRSKNDHKLDTYLSDTRKALKNKKNVQREKTSHHKQSSIAPFTQWKGCASMDLTSLAIVCTVLLVSSGICLIIHPDIVPYFFFALGTFFTGATIYCVIDYRHFTTWKNKLNFKLEGWESAVNSRSRDFWKLKAEHWVCASVTIAMSENASDKHRQVSEAFLGKLRRRLDQWTVSSETHIGYTQPNGWRILDLTLTGDMNARVLNLMRKRLSGEFRSLSELMPDAVERVVISAAGKETHHEVYVDSD